MGVPLVIIHFNGIVPSKPSSYWGTPMAMENPDCEGYFQVKICGTIPNQDGGQDWKVRAHQVAGKALTPPEI